MKKKYKKLIIVETIIILIVIAIYIFQKKACTVIWPICPYKKYFGILCPGCGATTCVSNFIKGNFIQSFKAHPLYFIVIVYLLILNIIFIINTFKKKKILEFWYLKSSYVIIWLIMFLIFEIIRNIL